MQTATSETERKSHDLKMARRQRLIGSGQVPQQGTACCDSAV